MAPSAPDGSGDARPQVAPGAAAEGEAETQWGLGDLLHDARVYGPNGARIEGRGTVPDIVVRTRRSDVMERSDPLLEAAVMLLRETSGDRPEQSVILMTHLLGNMTSRP